MIAIDEALVRRLVADQFPEWAGLPVRSVPRQGWDNRTFRLGDQLTVRLPSAAGYVAAVAKEDRWLPELAPLLPVPIPTPVAVGEPAHGYPFPWSVRRWLDGRPLDATAPASRSALAAAIGDFLVALRGVRLPGAPVGPLAGAHSFFRGCHPGAYADEVQRALETLGSRVDSAACWRIWREGMVTVWTDDPVWFHGDVAVGNILLDEAGALGAMIDFGTCGVGDPACDLQIAWTYFDGPDRRVLREHAALDDDCWRRARAWALWKELITVDPVALDRPDGTPVLRALLDDPVVTAS